MVHRCLAVAQARLAASPGRCSHQTAASGYLTAPTQFPEESCGVVSAVIELAPPAANKNNQRFISYNELNNFLIKSRSLGLHYLFCKLLLIDQFIIILTILQLHYVVQQ